VPAVQPLQERGTVLHSHSHDGGHGVAHLHTDEGLRTATIATAGLLATGLLELVIFVISGSDGLHRAEDLAGLFVLLVMAASAVAAGWESLQHVMGGETPDHLVPGMIAAL